MIEDTMFPKRPEDWETAIPQDPKALKEEVMEEMVNNSEPFWMEKNRELQKQNKPQAVKCTCAKRFFTSRKNKKKGTTEMRRTQANGYTNQGCPVHFRH
jgi:hypothetical protein